MSKGRGDNKILLFVHGLTFLVSIIFSLLLPKALGVQDYIIVMQITAFINFLLPICAFASPTLMIRQYNSLDRSVLFLQIIKLYLLGSLLVTAIIVFTLLYLDVMTINIAILVFFITLFSSVLTGIAAFARAQTLLFLYSLCTILVKLNLLLIVTFFYIDNTLSATHLLFLWTLSGGIVLFLAFVYMEQPLSIAKLNSDVVEKNELLNMNEVIVFCFPVVFANLLTMLLPLLERFLLGGLISSGDLALYLFNIDILAKFSSVILLALKVVVFPKIMLTKKGLQVELFYTYLKKVSIIIFFVFLASPFLSYLYGVIIAKFIGYNEYYDFYVVILLITYSLVIPFNYMLTIGLVIINKNKFLLVSTSMTLFLHVVGILVFSEKYAALGASSSLFFSFLISSLILLFYTLVKVNEYKSN
ncbi:MULTISPECIES: hypothetical protein [unclassified Pseudoalteromonas]|uniref:hypothetical protein n=1 Tax=unclassified Pseudoalteromonas TaxID=194690 RepID=UPI0011084308|nr:MULTISPECIES: hypothetical protein [unclassified Pseudoalteromonas]TMN77042.1 hypothetical protein CWB64_17900 [Pseudoalteromonas sp. S410]TMN87477.1 hypothetical protein CWB62_18135 [Pseudoalteromonas sp. S408]TMN95554.1 hypothetical protein CWB63_17760 [Pseudoalteromonas sp. S409]TMN98290.1 hypothetical protein CWB61_07430 [Pseudoalteromonas sp. S407]TMO07360.1 hypothetical protein CWB57_16105 [Pseudoalteromonas sp. S186]